MSQSTAQENEDRLRRLRRLAFVLDDSIPIPVINRRIGLDSVLGLVPIAGDLIGGALAAYVLYSGHRLGASFATLLRMTGNVVLEMIVGAVPLLGDLFDMGFKANLRNVRLLEAHAVDPAGVERRSLFLSVAVVAGIGATLVGAALVTVAVAVVAVRALVGLF